MDETREEPTRQEVSFWEKVTRRKLRNYLFLDKRLQFNFALLLSIVGLFNAAYFSALVYFHTRESFLRLTASVPEYLISEESYRENYKLFLTTVLFTTIGEAILVVLLGLFFSHRVAGPLYAMGQKLKQLTQGHIPDKIRLRKNDFLTNFADSLNETISKLQEKEDELKQAIQDLDNGNTNGCKERLKKLIS